MPIVGDRRNPYPPPAEVLYFLIHDEERREKGYKFPSPLGELYFLIEPQVDANGFMNMFPSPLGELYFLMRRLDMLRVLTEQVSVPSRGAIFLNTAKEVGMVSSEEFPSPLGELYFLIKVGPYTTHTYCVSVPSRGAIFLNTVTVIHMMPVSCFRPLSGSYIS